MTLLDARLCLKWLACCSMELRQHSKGLIGRRYLKRPWSDEHDASSTLAGISH